MRRVTAVAGLAVTLLASACGTTVQVAHSSAGPEGLGLGQTPTGSAVQPLQPQGVNPRPVAGGSTDGGQSTELATGSVAASRGGAPVSSAAPAASAGVRGVTASTITVGIPLPSDTSAVATSMGIQGAGTIAPQDMVAAVTRDVNKSGGVLGRKLVVYEHSYSAAQYISNQAQVDAAICTDFSQDHHVFAVMFDLVDAYVRQCTRTMGSPLFLVGGLSSFFPASDYTGSFLYGPTAITADRLAHLFVQSLMARDFTQKWNITAGGPGVNPTRLGLIHADNPDQNAYYADVAKELAKYGVKFTDTATYDSNVQAGLAATQSAVLRFRADGITHVFGASAFFLQDAESQKYYPRYAYLPGLGQLGVANSPSDQLNGALTVGWSPVSDVPANKDPGDTPGAKHCRAVMNAGGMSTDSRSDLKTMYEVCDAIYSFRAALTAGRVASVAGLRTGFEAMGSSFPTALTFNAVLGTAHHYGVDSVRDMAYNTACKCLEYTSRTNRS